MDASEFIQLTKSVADRLTPKIADQLPEQARFIREDLDEAEWENALSNLIACLVQQQTTISAADREDLSRLMEKLGEPTEDIDRLTVESSGG